MTKEINRGSREKDAYVFSVRRAFTAVNILGKNENTRQL